MCPESRLKRFPGLVPGQMPDAVRGGGAKEDKEVSNGRSRRGFGFSMRGTLDGVEKQIPIPQHNQIVSFIWGIADDVLRDLYVRGKYRDVILPMTV